MQIRNRALIGVVAVVLLSLLAVGCGDNEDPNSDPEPVLTRVVEGETEPVVETVGPTVVPSAPDLTSDGPPDTTASSGGMTVEMGVGTYCWTRLCVDKIGPITRDTLKVTPGDEISVEIPDGTPRLREVSVIAFPAAEPQQLDNGETAWRADYDNGVTLRWERDEDAVRIDGTLEPGTYVLTVGMFFEPGDVQYGVVLEVE
ncbi:MAG TPA: hypothetical protein VFS30_02315 [Dehalococcoidia bacterium]|nr:hypothetical protein [Dehalococcoidia bacterium]